MGVTDEADMLILLEVSLWDSSVAVLETCYSDEDILQYIDEIQTHAQQNDLILPEKEIEKDETRQGFKRD